MTRELHIQCWGEDGAGCDAVLHDDSLEGMEVAEWGWVWARDPGADSGYGFFFACPAHKDTEAWGDAVETDAARPTPEGEGRVTAPFVHVARAQTMLRDFNRLREAIRSHDSDATEAAWEKCERWVSCIDPNARAHQQTEKGE